MIIWIAFTLTLLSQWLVAKRIIWCFVVGGIGNILWLCCYIPLHLWSPVALNSVFLVLSLYGWLNWKKRNEETQTNTKTSKA